MYGYLAFCGCHGNVIGRQLDIESDIERSSNGSRVFVTFATRNPTPIICLRREISSSQNTCDRRENQDPPTMSPSG